MAQAPTLSLRREDFETLQSPDDLDRFFRPLNAFGQQVNAALAKGLTLSDNAAAFVKTLTVTTSPRWALPALLNGWADYGSPNARGAYAIYPDNTVELRGTVKNGTSLSAIFVLPAGYRPPATQSFATLASGGDGAVNVAADGTVSHALGSTTFLCLDGISFSVDGGPVPSLLSAPLRFKNDLQGKPLSVRVARAQDTTSQPAAPVALGPVAWATSQDQIVVSDIAGLLPSRKYQIAFVVEGA